MTNAAVPFELHKLFESLELALEGPRKGDVLIRFGLRHTLESSRTVGCDVKPWGTRECDAYWA